MVIINYIVIEYMFRFKYRSFGIFTPCLIHVNNAQLKILQLIKE